MKRTNVGSYLKIKNICNAEVIDLEKLAQKKKKRHRKVGHGANIHCLFKNKQKINPKQHTSNEAKRIKVYQKQKEIASHTTQERLLECPLKRSGGNKNLRSLKGTREFMEK